MQPQEYNRNRTGNRTGMFFIGALIFLQGSPWPLVVLLVTDIMGMQKTLETVSTLLLPDRCTAIEGLGWVPP